MKKQFNTKLRKLAGAGLLLLFITVSLYSKGANVTVSSNMNWSAITGGSGIGGVPTSMDNVTIKGNATVTVNITNAACGSLTLGAGGNKAGTVTFAANGSPVLTVAGTSGVLTVNASGGGIGLGTVTMVSGATLSVVTFSGAGVYSLNAGTVILRGSFSLPAGVNTFNNLTINSNGTVTAAASTTINGTLCLTKGIYAAGTNVTMASGSAISRSAGSITGTIQGSNSFAVSYTGNSITEGPELTGGASVRSALTMNMSTGLTLTTPLTLTGTLTLTSGVIVLNGNNITAGSVSGGNSASYVQCDNTATGATLTIKSVSGSVTFPIGTDDYTPVTVNNTGSTQDFSALVFDGVLQDGLSGSDYSNIDHAVNKTWHVTNLGTNPNVALTTQWNAADENASFSRSNSFIGHYTGGAWNDTTSVSATGSDPYSQTRSGITSFSPFFVGDNISPLPIQLISFNAILQNKAVELTWATASEINNNYFTIERSADGIHFDNIMTKPGAGNSQSVINYTAYDEQPLAGTSYYRLKQTDYNGASKTFNMVSVNNNVSMQDFNIASAYPTLFSDNFTVNYKVPAGGDVRVVVTSMSGAIVQDMTVPANMGDNNLNISNTTGWRSGIYVVQLYYNNWVNYIKVNKSL